MENEKEVLNVENEKKDVTLDDAIKILNAKSKIQDMIAVEKNIKEQQLKVIKDEEIVDKLQDKIKDMHVEMIKNLSADKIKEIYTIDGNELDLDMVFKTDDQRTNFLKDYLIYLKESSQALAEIDKATIQLDNEMKEYDKELEQIISEFGDINKCIKTKLEKDIADAPDEIVKNKRIKMLQNYNDGFELNNIYKLYASLNIKNTIKDYFSKDTSAALYGKYLSVVKKLNIRTDITLFDNLEIKFLPEKYHKYPNLFLFSIIRYAAYRKDVANKHEDGVFLAQLMINIKYLFSDGFSSADDKSAFISNIEKTLDLFY